MYSFIKQIVIKDLQFYSFILPGDGHRIKTKKVNTLLSRNLYSSRQKRNVNLTDGHDLYWVSSGLGG